MLNNIKTKERGFTLVELLIVIVVIAILAAISIVAYNGITNRGKTNSGAALAAQVQKKIEALYVIKGTYFATAGAQAGSAINTLANAAPTVTEAVLDQPGNVLGVATSATVHGLTSSNGADGKAVSVWGCAGGANIWYWDYQTGAVSTNVIKAGAGC